MSFLAWSRLFIVFAIIVGQKLIADPAQAQNTSGVSNPDVTDGAHSLGYRNSVAPSEGQDAFSHRVDYGHSFSDRTKTKFVVTQNNQNGDLKIRHVQIEGQYQFAKMQEGWNSAIQLQGRVPTAHNVSGRMRIGWQNSFDLTSRVEFRAVLLAAREFGELARDGIALETRSELTVSDLRDMRLGVQMFNKYNTTADFGDFNEQQHQIGPIIRGQITDDLKYGVGALFGVSRAANDAELRIFLGYSL